MICGKCRETSGNDWSQCGGSCPIPASPHFDEGLRDAIEERDGISVGPRATPGLRGASPCQEDAVPVVMGLMEVARIAMPDTYYATDSRVQAARRFLGFEQEDRDD